MTCCMCMMCFKTGQIQPNRVFAEGFWGKMLLSGPRVSAGCEQENSSPGVSSCGHLVTMEGSGRESGETG